MNNPIDLIIGRNSHAKLIEPAPSPEHRQLIFKSALRAPDHGMIKPWQFLVVEGEAREALGQLFAETAKTETADLPETQYQKLKKAPLRAPLIIVAIAKVIEHPKAPRDEQLLSAGSAIHQMLLAAEALGYAGIWRTGSVAYSPGVRAALGLEEQDAIAGYLYLGTPEGNRKKVPEASIDDYFKPLQLG